MDTERHRSELMDEEFVAAYPDIVEAIQKAFEKIEIDDNVGEALIRLLTFANRIEGQYYSQNKVEKKCGKKSMPSRIEIEFWV